MARRVKRSTSKQWRNIRFKVTWRVGSKGYTEVDHAVYDSARFFPTASMDDIQAGIELWCKLPSVLVGVEYLKFEDGSDVWPCDGGHEWKRAFSRIDRGNGCDYYRCACCDALAKRWGDAEPVRSTGEKVCPTWRRRAHDQRA